MTLRRARPLSVRQWPPLLLRYGLIFPPGAVLTTAAFWPMWQGQPLLALGNEFLSLAALAAGILLLDEPGQQRPAIMLMGASALLTAGWLNAWAAGPLPLISVPASSQGIVLASWAMFCYPHAPGQVQAGRRFFVIVLGWFLAGDITSILTSRPQWYGFPARAWWPSLLPDRPLTMAVSQVAAAGGIGFAVIYMLMWLRRWKLSRGISRRLALPVAVAASVICAATVFELAATVLSAGPATLERIYTVESYAQIGVPAAFVISIMQRRFARTRIVDLLLHLSGPARAPSVASALRTVFEDPGLEVLSWPAETRPAAGAGELGPGPGSSHRGRLVLPIMASSGEQLAVVVADPSMSPHDDLVRAALAASSFALENAHLEAALRAQLQEVRDSRLRIIEAGTEARRRLERDLHDGTQQRLLGLKIMLAAAESDVGDPRAQAVIARVRSELGQVLDELRDLAHGIHPAVLSQVGLAEAIASMAERYAIPVRVDLPPGRFGEAAEITAYFLIAECVSNAIRHAACRAITVRGERAADGFLLIRVADDGRGGACPAAGLGLRGVIDRVRGVGGEMDIDSPAGQGTRIEARIPCA
jgi:signal transduction histidine kinase